MIDILTLAECRKVMRDTGHPGARVTLDGDVLRLDLPGLTDEMLVRRGILDQWHWHQPGFASKPCGTPLAATEDAVKFWVGRPADMPFGSLPTDYICWSCYAGPGEPCENLNTGKPLRYCHKTRLDRMDW